MWNSPTPTGIDQLTPRLLQVYRRTSYAVNNVVVRIGRRSPALDSLLAKYGATVGVFITAWNHRSRLKPPRWNERLQDRLRQRLRHQVTLPAVRVMALMAGRSCSRSRGPTFGLTNFALFPATRRGDRQARSGGCSDHQLADVLATEQHSQRVRRILQTIDDMKLLPQTTVTNLRR